MVEFAISLLKLRGSVVLVSVCYFEGSFWWTSVVFDVWLSIVITLRFKPAKIIHYLRFVNFSKIVYVVFQVPNWVEFLLISRGKWETIHKSNANKNFFATLSIWNLTAVWESSTSSLLETGFPLRLPMALLTPLIHSFSSVFAFFAAPIQTGLVQGPFCSCLWPIGNYEVPTALAW